MRELNRPKISKAIRRHQERLRKRGEFPRNPILNAFMREEAVEERKK